MKKVISLLMLLCMIIGVFAGCGGSKDSGGPVTLRWVMPWYMQDDYDMVSEEINKQLGELLPNTKLELVLDMSMASKWNLWMAGRTPFDIALSQYTNDLGTEINKNAYMPLNDLIDEYAPTIKKEMETYEYQYLTGTYNGKLYAIPNIQIHVNDVIALTLNTKEMAKYLDSKALYAAACASPKSGDALYSVIDKYLAEIYKHKELIDTTESAPYIDPQTFYNYIAKRGYEFLGTTTSNLCYEVFTKDNSVKVIDFHETEEFKTYIKWMRKWYEAGYINKDILSEEAGSGRQCFLLAQAFDFSASENGYENFYNDQYRISLSPVEQRYTGAAVLGSLHTYLSIPTTSENPERAIKLIELLRTKEGADLLNTIVYGIKDVHYEETSDTEIKGFGYLQQGNADTPYGLANWMCGTHFNMKVIYPYSEATREYAKKYYTELLPTYHKTAIYGLSMDNNPVRNELTQMKAVCDEYLLRLIGGVTSDYNSVLSTMQQKMDLAGIDKVIKEYQSQINDYISSHKK